MAADQGYKVAKNALPVVSKYAMDKKRMANECFGNAREMRKLLGGAVVSLSMRNMSGEKSELISKEDVIFAVKRASETAKSGRLFGFNVSGSNGNSSVKVCTQSAI